MKNRIVIIGIAVLLICIGLSGCNNTISNSEINRFVGTWKAENNYEMTFFSNGTCNAINLGNRYEIEEGKLIFIMDVYEHEVNITYDYYFSDDDTILYLKLVGGDGTTTAFRKQ